MLINFMSKNIKHVFTLLKTIAIIFLSVVVFNFFFDRANQPTEEEQIEAMLGELEKQVKTVTTSKDSFEYPIQRRPAAEYRVTEKSIEDARGDQYLFICAVSSAVGMVQRAQTLVNLGLDHQNELTVDVDKMVLMLAPAETLCEESRVIAIGYFVPAGTGWTGISSGDWQWLVRTSHAKVSADEIEATQLYMSKKAEFIADFGMMDYPDKLDEFVAEQLGRDPKYVTAGMWNDDFVKR